MATVNEGTVTLTVTMFLQSVLGSVPLATTDLSAQGTTISNLMLTQLPAGTTIAAPVVTNVVSVQDYPV
jgi:hypothetical protein